jgi:hypothetical protein
MLQQEPTNTLYAKPIKNLHVKLAMSLAYSSHPHIRSEFFFILFLEAKPTELNYF